MVEQDETTTQHPVLDPDAFDRYVIRAPREIAILLRSMAEKRTLLSAYIGNRGISFVTAVLDVIDDGTAVILDASPDGHVNERAAAAGALTCVTQMGGVRIQFAVENVTHIRHDDLSALRAPIPDALLRLQRRESYRLAVPMTNPIECEIRMTAPDETARVIEARVVDISTNGISISAPASELSLSLGTDLDECTVTLPDAGATPIRLRVRNLHHAVGANGVDVVRAGCQFIDPPAKFAARVQRYIFTVERDRRMLEPGN